MLVNGKDILLKYKNKHLGIPQFNVNNLENIKYLLEIVNTYHLPIIIGVSEGAIKYMGGYSVVSSITKELIKNLKVIDDVILHLDHGSSVESCKNAIDCGFTSVMYDGSKLSIDENIKNINEVAEYARKYNVSVEGELGYLGTKNDKISYTNLEDVSYYLNNTNIGSLAIAIGNVHGLYKDKPLLNIDLLRKINSQVNIPLVLHGGSGLSEKDFIDCIKNGITKININTELQIAWTRGVRNCLDNDKEVYDPRKIINSGETNFKDVVVKYLNIFNNVNI